MEQSDLTSSFIFDCLVSLAAAFRIDYRITETNLMLLKQGKLSQCHGQNGGGGEKRLDSGGRTLRIWEQTGYGVREEQSRVALRGLFELLILFFLSRDRRQGTSRQFFYGLANSF